MPVSDDEILRRQLRLRRGVRTELTVFIVGTVAALCRLLDRFDTSKLFAQGVLLLKQRCPVDRAGPALWPACGEVFHEGFTTFELRYWLQFCRDRVLQKSAGWLERSGIGSL